MTRSEILQSIAYDHTQFRAKAGHASQITALAVSLLVVALIVVVAGCLCLTLKGVNVIRHVIWPAVIPASVAALISFPLFLRGSKYFELAKPYRTRYLDDTYKTLSEDEHIVSEQAHTVYLEETFKKLSEEEGSRVLIESVEKSYSTLITSPVKEMQKEELISFLKEHLCGDYFNKKPPVWGFTYTLEFLTALKKKLPQKKEERTPEQQTLFEALNGLTKEVKKDFRTDLKTRFFLKHFVKKPPEWGFNYTVKLLAALKEKLPKKEERTFAQNVLVESLDELTKDVVDEWRLFMEEHIFPGYFMKTPKEWDRNYVTKLMTEIKAKFPEKKADRTPQQAVLFEAMDEVAKDLRAKHLADREKKKKKEAVD